MKMRQYKTIIKQDNQISGNHILHGEKVLPGVVYLQFCMSILRSEGIGVNNVVFEDVLFFTPMNLKSDRELEIRFEKNDETWFVEGMSSEIHSNDWVKHFECRIVERNELRKNEKIDLENLINSSSEVRDVDEAYKYVRDAGIVHKSFMKPHGEVYYLEDAILGHIYWSETSNSSGDMVKRAAVFDSSTVLPYLSIENEYSDIQRDKAFIPLCISEFRIYGEVPTDVYIHVKKEDVFLADNEDICYASWKIYNHDGEIVAEFTRLSSKKIRIEGFATSEKNRVVEIKNASRENHVEQAKTQMSNVDLDVFTREFIENKIGEYVDLESGNEKYNLGFFDLGLSSKHMVEIVRTIEKDLNCRLYPTILFEYSTINELCGYLIEEHKESLMQLKTGEDITPVSHEEQTVTTELLPYELVWREEKCKHEEKRKDNRFVVITGDDELDELGGNGEFAISVRIGNHYEKIDKNRYLVNPFSVEDWIKLWNEFRDSKDKLVIVNLLDYEVLRGIRAEFLEQNVYLYNIVLLQSLKLSGISAQIDRIIHIAYHRDGIGYTRALAGLHRCYYKESGLNSISVVVIENEVSPSSIRRLIMEEAQEAETTITEIRYSDSVRLKKVIMPTNVQNSNSFAKNGVYIVTGGYGKAIKSFIEASQENSGCKFILLGRSALDNDKKAWLDKVNQNNLKVEYKQLNICDEQDTFSVIREIIMREKEITGVIHAAGLIDDELVESKKLDWSEYDKVIECKVVGWNNIVRALDGVHVDVVIFFSSIAAAFGNVGQSNYAYSNAYLDNYYLERNAIDCDALVSINWPLLDCGGMDGSIDAQYLLNTTGMKLLNTNYMTEFLWKCKKQNAQYICIDGDKTRIENEIAKMYDVVDSANCNKNDTYSEIKQEEHCEEIAIIGMDAKFPMADNLDEFWNNLIQGKDCVTRIPSDRWTDADVEKILGSSGLDVCKFGGFLRDIDSFDTKLFNITPIEAKNMDPQERLFMSSVWRTIEDAGYSKTALNNRKIGVFAGSMWGHYQMGETQIDDSVTIASSIYASISNRVSSYFNWHGPSMTLDTMCSSVMTAMNLACESIKSGKSELAVVGGVNLSLHPKKYIVLAQNNFTSKEGKCRSFGEGGQGYVPGEGVGSFLLKRLDKAICDNDHIYGIIKACEINHGGKTSGYSVPNPKMQAEVISSAFKTANISAEDVSYIEAHGTGTALGDPIEINALQNVFSKYTNKRQYCSIGSVKSNIGHLEAASCVAGIAKVLLQFKYGKLVPSIHSEVINKNIHFEDTAFFCQHAYEEWKSDGPRIAGISAFGAGGSNGHLVLQEYKETRKTVGIQSNPDIYIYSAQDSKVMTKVLKSNLEYLLKNKGRLSVSSKQIKDKYNEIERAIRSVLCPGYSGESTLLYMRDLGLDIYQVERIRELLKEGGYQTPEYEQIMMHEKVSDLIDGILAYNAIDKYIENSIEEQNGANEKLRDFMERYAYTLAIGRESMPQRIAFIARSIDELIEKISDYLNTGKAKQMFSSNTLKEKNDIFGIFDTEEGKQLVKTMFARRYYEKVLQLWCAGVDINWGDLYENRQMVKMSIPCYPFSGERIQRAKFSYNEGDKNAYTELVNSDSFELQIYQQDWKQKNAEMLSDNVGNVLVLSNQISNYEVYMENVTSVSDYWTSEDKNQVLEKNLSSKVDTIIVQWPEKNENNGVIEEVYSLVKKVIDKGIKCKIVCVYSYLNFDQNTILKQAIVGFAKTLYLENQDIQIKVVTIDKSYLINNKTSLEQIVVNEIRDCERDFEICYDNERKIPSYQNASVSNTLEVGILTDGCYVIAGGCGSIGLVTARYLLRNTSAKVVLLGRKKMDEAALEKLFGGDISRVSYYSLNIARLDQVEAVYKAIKDKGLRITGIINSAGTFKNSFIQNKQMNDVETVLSSKVLGTLNLHHVFSKEPLEIFGLYSSIAGVFGKVGQADYAYANNYLNKFVTYREYEKKQGKCSGNTVCINWPYWSNGGMHIDEYEIEMLMDQYGIAPLNNENGEHAIGKLLSATSGCYTVLYGQSAMLQNLFGEVSEENQVDYDKSDFSDDITAMTEKWLLSLFCQLFEYDLDSIDVDTDFGVLGIDSVGFNRLQAKMEKALGIMKKTLMYETKNVSELASYLVEAKYDKLKVLFGNNHSQDKEMQEASSIITTRYEVTKEHNALPLNRDDEDIAIIGMSGRFPGANSCLEFWNNIKAGVDSVGVIPSNRWDTSKFNNGDVENLESGTSYCKWGGFIDDVESFDYQFFRISPKEAQTTDPQERLFLEVAYEVFEDAGYNSERLDKYRDENGSANIGVFVSGASNTYNLIGLDEWAKGNYVVPNALPWSISNRVSYCMNFSGPSFTVDAACAGGIVSLHQAINALRNGECNMALAGGVNLYLHPYKYVSLSQVKMLSKTGKCYAFSDKADGFVPGESVAGVLLKPLSQARKDCDYIYGVIKASGINHDGASNGYMAPNPSAQTTLIKRVIKDAKVDARQISYVEAHGTGTPVGDPIEVNALTRAFRDTTQEKQYCALGSIKTNIGHSEGAAAIVGLIKVLLQMKHKTIVPSLYADNPSKAIDFADTPFVLQKGVSEWNRMIVGGKEVPRIASISSFGAGGANGHVIVEENVGQEASYEVKRGEIDSYIFPISAQTPEQLLKMINDLLMYITNCGNNLDIQRLAYTLQVSKCSHDRKIAFIANSVEKLIELLEKYVSNQNCTDVNVLRNVVRTKKNYVDLSHISNTGSNESCHTIAEYWVNGLCVDWTKLYSRTPILYHLPHYPFQKKKCWVKTVDCIKSENITIMNNLSETSSQKKTSLDELTSYIENDEINIDLVKNVLSEIL